MGTRVDKSRRFSTRVSRWTVVSVGHSDFSQSMWLRKSDGSEVQVVQSFPRAFAQSIVCRLRHARYESMVSHTGSCMEV